MIFDEIDRGVGGATAAAVGRRLKRLAGDAQVLVVNDLLGITPTLPKFAKDFLQEGGSVFGAIQQYSADVRTGDFPEEKHIFH